MSNLDFIIRVISVLVLLMGGLPLIAMFVRIFWIIGTEAGRKALLVRQANRENNTAPDNKAVAPKLKTHKYN